MAKGPKPVQSDGKIGIYTGEAPLNPRGTNAETHTSTHRKYTTEIREKNLERGQRKATQHKDPQWSDRRPTGMAVHQKPESAAEGRHRCWEKLPQEAHVQDTALAK